jgi:hypothetical protein
METKKIFFSSEEISRIDQIDMSLHRWSSEYTDLSLKLHDMMNGIKSLTESKKKIITDRIRSAGIDLSRVVSIDFTDNGEAQVSINPLPEEVQSSEH